MGAKLSEHRGKFSAGGWLWYLGGLAVVAAGLGFFNAVKKSLADQPGGGDMALTALATLGVGLVLLIVPVLRWRQTVVCYERGIVWRRLLGERVIPREQLRSAQLIHHRGRHTNYDEVELVTTTGSVSIVGVAQPEQICNHVRAWLRGTGFDELGGAPPQASSAVPLSAGGWPA